MKDTIRKILKSNNFKAEFLYSLYENSFIIVLILILFLTYSTVRVLPVNSGSMYPVMKKGDLVVQVKLKKINRNDIVSVKTQGFDGSTIYYEKRIVGMPNDEIEIRCGTLYINREIFKNDFGSISNLENGYIRDMNKIIVPDNEFFIMGDNKDFSVDSRDFGTIKKEQIRYKIIKVIKFSNLKKNKEYF